MQSSSLGILTQELMAAGMPADTGDVDEIIRAAGWKSTGATVLIAAVWKKAVGGDVNAAKLIREMNGESSGDSGAVDLSQMSDAELRRMADGEALMSWNVDKSGGDASIGSTDRGSDMTDGVIGMGTGECKGNTYVGSSDRGVDKADGVVRMGTGVVRVDTSVGSTDRGKDMADGVIGMGTGVVKVDATAEGKVSSRIGNSKSSENSSDISESQERQNRSDCSESQDRLDRTDHQEHSARPARNDSDKGSFYKGYGCAAPW